MQHVIIGSGYVGQYLARYLNTMGESVITVSRQDISHQLCKGIKHLSMDVLIHSLPVIEDACWYYLIPPNQHGVHDLTLKRFLELNPKPPKRLIYFGSSGVYGNHNGDFVSELSDCHIEFDRQKRRLDAEKQIKNFLESAIILRVAGIVGKERLPVDAAKNQIPVVKPEQAPWTNLIDVKDLAKIASYLATHSSASGIFNVSNGHPVLMGYLQQQTARLLNLPLAKELDLDDMLKNASDMKKEFLKTSKRLNISKLQAILGKDYDFYPLTALWDDI